MAEATAADTLRDKSPAEVRPEAAPEKMPLDQWFLGMVAEADKRREATAAEAQQYFKTREAELDPLRKAVTTAAQAPQTPVAVPPPEIKPPTPGIRPFAEGMPGESNAQVLNRTLMSLGLLAQMGVGVAKGNPQGALAAYTGALRGWQQGDTIRGQEQWAEYLAYIHSMQRAYQNTRTMYEDIDRQHAGDLQRRRLELGIAAARQDERGEAIQLAFQNDRAFLDQVKLAGTMLEKMHQDALNMSLKVEMERDRQARFREVQDFKQQELQWKREEAGLRRQDQLNKLGGVQQKTIRSLDVMDDGMNRMEATLQELQKDGMLPTDDTAASAALAWKNRMLHPNASSLRKWQNLQPIVIGFDRNVLGDIGPRAIAAFSASLRFFDHPPTLQAGLDVVNQMRGQLNVAKGDLYGVIGKGAVREGLGMTLAPPPGQAQVPKGLSREEYEMARQRGYSPEEIDKMIKAK